MGDPLLEGDNEMLSRQLSQLLERVSESPYPKLGEWSAAYLEPPLSWLLRYIAYNSIS